MKLLVACAALCVLLQGVVAPPVTANKKEDAEKEHGAEGGEHKGADWDIGLEYNRYLQEVVQALESDPQFRDKLEKAEVADIRTGKIASELEFVNHNVRSKLDELKRQELERLRHLAIKQYELTKQQEEEQQQGDHENSDQGYGYDHHPNEINDPGRLRIPHHVDHKNPHSFEIDDLRKLIVQTTKDLEEADRKRREEFKEYEMQKEYEKSQQLNLLDEEHKKEMEEKIHEQEEKHKQHPTLHHPGSKHQLEQVWEEQDHMNPEDFNPKTFFHLHDLDGNGFWDADEVKTLFQKELDKMYDPNAPEDDMRERREEMERMREHVFNETDVNRDQLISYQEFLDQTKKQEFDQDPGWDGLDNQKLYTQEEYEEFERRRQAEVQRMIEQGMLPPQPDQMHLPYGLQVPPEYYQHHQQVPHQGQPLPPHGQQYPPQYRGHGAPPQQYHPDPYAGHQAPVHSAQQQQHHQQGQPQYHAPPQHNQGQAVHHNQPPVQQMHHNQPPVHHNQPPVHHQGQPIHQQGQPIHQQGQPIHQQGQPIHQQGQPIHQQAQGMHQQGQPIHQQAQQVHQNQPPVHHQQGQPIHQNQQHNPPPVQQQHVQNPPPVHQSQAPDHQNSQQNVPPSPHQAQHPNDVPVNAAPPSNAVHQSTDTQGTAKLTQAQQHNPQDMQGNEIPNHIPPQH